ncbi:MAG: lysophospholipid acyltransferase family protein [Hyphomicrobiales bacterium]
MTGRQSRIATKVSGVTVIRSVLFNIVFYLNLVFFMIIGVVGFATPRRMVKALLVSWAETSCWWLKVLAHVKVEIRGRERIPQGGVLVAVKHQSLWETFALFTMLNDPAIVLKRELLWIPVFGWYIRRLGMIPVDRKAGARALRRMEKLAHKAIEQDRQVVIFPEGTRRAPGAPPDYKSGIAALCLSLGLPCVPVALNSGLFWPRRRFMRYPGTIVIQFLDPITPHCDRKGFSAELETRLETATSRLIDEARSLRAGPL